MALFSKSKSFNVDGENVAVPWWMSCRLTILVVTFFTAFCNYTMRTNMSVAIVCMTSSSSADKDGNNRTDDSQTHDLRNMYHTSQFAKGEFDWSQADIGWVLSAFYVGYIFTQFVGGIAAARFGAKLVLGGSTVLLALLTLVTPPAARVSVYLLMTVQVLKGMASGVFIPGFYQLWGRWAAPQERAIMLSIGTSGFSIGTVVSSILSGYLCDHGFAGGWPSIFYVFGLFSLLWCIAWYLLAYSSPAEHPRISTAELNYIQDSLPACTEKLQVPWKSLLRTRPIYINFLTDFCNAWSFYICLTYLPQYMDDVLKVNIQSNGLYNSLPPLCNVGVAGIGGLLADFIVRKQLLTLTWNRKLLHTLGTIPSAAISIWIAYLTVEDKTLAIVLLALWGGLTAFSISGSFANNVDIAPRYSGIIMGIDNTISTLSGILVPPVTSAMTKHGTADEWKNVFFLAAAIPVSGWTAYIILGDATEQEWAKTKEHGITIKETEGQDNPGYIREEGIGENQPSYKLREIGETAASSEPTTHIHFIT